MPTDSTNLEPAIGFLTVLFEPGVGHLGGYLVLNSRARPLEFHCTAPVQPSRTHEVLYGVALRSYLYGEQIADALLSRSKEKPMLLVSNRSEIIAARPLDVPSLLIPHDVEFKIESDTPSDIKKIPSIASPSTFRDEAIAQWVEFKLGTQVVRIAAEPPGDQAKIEQMWGQYQGGLDLLEPFLRIREALQEAHRPSVAA